MHERRVTILTLASLPKADADRLEEINKAKDATALRKFWVDFTQREAKDERAKGVFILVCRHPGRVEMIADKVMRDNGFDKSKEDGIRDILLASFKDAAGKPDAEATAIRDKGLLEASRVLHNEVPVTTDTKAAHVMPKNEESKGSGIMGYVCIGLAVLVGLWLVFGLIRAFTGGGGGGGGMGGGGMGGGGGGGFMTGLLGGLFGSMAGMWLYNNMMGGGMSSAFGNSGADSSGGDSGNTGDEAGTGDFSGDSGSGGDFDGDSGGTGGDSGGGDWGGGGDTGGGGDWGGGGDFGGGGGDF